MTTFWTSAVTVLLCYFTYLHESNKIFTLTTYKMTKLVIKTLQGSAVTETK